MTFRLLLLPMFVLIELALLVAAWSVVWFAPDTARRIKDWAMHNIPDPDWYKKQDGAC